MKALKLLSLMMGVCLFCSCHIERVGLDDWNIVHNNDGTVTVEKDSMILFKEIYASYILDGKTISTKDYSSSKGTVSFATESGAKVVYQITYTDKKLPELVQYFYLYPNKDYFLTEFVLRAFDGIVSSNYMAPVNLNNLPAEINKKESRALFIPFDNDCWIRYQSHPLAAFDQLRSYEVTSIFDNDTRKGLVIGSVEHGDWKTAIEMNGDGNRLQSLVCYGGAATDLTRDSKPHGALTGKQIKSPKVLVGFFDDWRFGLDQYAEANASVAPPKAWNKAMPFGWNSWGVLQFGMTYPKAMEVSDYFAKNLQDNGFLNAENTLYVGLDSEWDSFTEEQLKAFVENCKVNGQVAGIYWTPFTDWGKNPEQTIQHASEYKFKDVYLYANGKPQDLDGAYAIDPTHPAIEMRMRETSDLFKRCGFEYVKLDFMTHGAMESDSWYNKDIQTGMQAYNYGMQLLNEYFGDMYINLSISPIFPAQYAQSRRIACDAWNKIKDVEYTMNAVSYGWWIDKVYQYNDADHIVLKDATEGENRARVTSAVITGLYIAGDDFSEEGSTEGKERASKYLTNRYINDLATGETFRPVEGNGEKSEHQFMRKDGSTTYYVFFNYEEADIELTVPLHRMGLDVDKIYTVTELWSGQAVDIANPITVPGKDVLVLALNP